MDRERKKRAGERGIHESISLLFSSRIILTLHDQVISDGEKRMSERNDKEQEQRQGMP